MDSADCVLRLSWEGFAALCRLLAVRVAAEYQPDVVVGIARGGTLPGALIALLLHRDFQSLQVPVPVLPPTLPAYLPSGEMIGGRRVLVVDERAPDGTALRWAMDALRKLGAREVRSLVLFTSKTGARTDYAGPEVGVITLQPWNRETVTVREPSSTLGSSAPVPSGGWEHQTGVTAKHTIGWRPDFPSGSRADEIRRAPDTAQTKGRFF